MGVSKLNKMKIFDLKGKTALITGGTGTLGFEFAKILAEAGSNIGILDLNEKECKDKAHKIIKEHSVQALGIACNITDEKEVNKTIKNVIDKLNKIDILINSAAITQIGNHTSKDYFKPFEDYPLDIWEKAIDVNLTGTFIITKRVVKEMLKQKKGTIINIASTYGLVSPTPPIYSGLNISSPIHYSVSKGGIIQFTRYLAAHLADKGIRVNTLSPGGVVEKNMDKIFVKRYETKTPLGRMADKMDYQGAILFLSSNASSYMTGANLVVDGGWTII